MMSAAKVASILRYRVLPTTLLALLTYFALFIALVVTDSLPNVPSLQKQNGLDLKEAYDDLRHITAHPHPYNSHANDRVRSYLLIRLHAITKDYPFVHISDDIVSNGSWASTVYGAYFEGTNILVKIDGTNSSAQVPDNSGVLFSAHYDSVSTAPGATDDGMGVATLLQLVRYFAKNRTRRTAVFNINNGEEDGLNGAHAFLEHPWSNLTNTFLNLEGAAAGGRPILFRATSTPSVRSFRNTKLVPHPHANVLSSDAFSRGLIRSGTDFSVYTGSGPRPSMEGLDLAFYKGRSRYHTKYDSVQYTVGGEKSLWSMMEVARGVGIGLLDAPFNLPHDVDVKEGDPAVYFDLFKSALVVFPLVKLLTFNILALIIGPVVLILILMCEKVLLRQKEKALDHPGRGDPDRAHSHSNRITDPHNRYQSPDSHGSHEHHSGYSPHRQLSLHLDHSGEEHEEEHHDASHTRSHSHGSAVVWIHTIWRHAKFWVALGVSVGALILLMWGYVVFNPFAIYSSPYIVFFSFLAFAHLVLVFSLTFPASLPFYHPKMHFLLNTDVLQPQQQKHTIFAHLYIFTWILLVLATIGITRLHPGLGSGYLVSAWNVCVGGGCLLAAIEGINFSTARGRVESTEGYEDLQGEEEREERRAPLSHRHRGDTDETTPLIRREDDNETHEHVAAERHLCTEEDEGNHVSTWWWIPQFLLSVPIPVTLLAHVTMLLLDAMPQTLADGANPWRVYSLTATCALLLVHPLAPFAYKLRPYRPLSLFVLVVFALSTLYAWLVFPFTVQAPLKVYFQQHVELPPELVGSSSTFTYRNASQPARLVTVLTGPKQYLRKGLVPYLASSAEDGKEVNCTDDLAKPGLVKCEWESGAAMAPVPGSLNQTDVLRKGSTVWQDGEFFKADIQRTGPASARIRLKGKNTRSCRVYFDSGPIYKYQITSRRRAPDDEEEEPAWEEPDKDFLSSGKWMQGGYEVGPKGIKEVRLWSRTWEKEFVLDVDWRSVANDSVVTTTGLKGRIACEWVEYESALIDNGPLGETTSDDGREGAVSMEVAVDKGAKIPASLEEVIAFLPEWAVVSKAADGLVEAWVPFVI